MHRTREYGLNMKILQIWVMRMTKNATVSFRLRCVCVSVTNNICIFIVSVRKYFCRSIYIMCVTNHYTYNNYYLVMYRLKPVNKPVYRWMDVLVYTGERIYICVIAETN